MLIAGNFGAVIGVVLGLQIERQGDVALYARSFAEVVHLDEVIEIASLFAGAFEVELADDVNFHNDSPLPFWFCSLPSQTRKLWDFREGWAFE